MAVLRHLIPLVQVHLSHFGEGYKTHAHTKSKRLSLCFYVPRQYPIFIITFVLRTLIFHSF
jgi:hypothetical protein